jgi:excisionase family DNA binding protein
MADVDALLTTKQLQHLLQVDRITIYRMLNDGRLHGFKVGGQWRFSREAIERWLEGDQSRLEALRQPPAREEGQPATDLLPLTCVQAIQEIVAEALGVGVVMTAPSGQPMTPIANSCLFCNLILGSEAGRQRCVGSWRAAAVQGRTPQLATCHAGLRYAWSPIVVGGQAVAVTYAGQFLDAPLQEGAGSARIEELAAAARLEAETLGAALRQVRRLEADRQQQLLGLVQRVGATLSEIGEERLRLVSRLQRIAEISQL